MLSSETAALISDSESSFDFSVFATATPALATSSVAGLAVTSVARLVSGIASVVAASFVVTPALGWARFSAGLSAVRAARSVVVAFEVFAKSFVAVTSFSTMGFVFSPTVVVAGDASE